MSFIGDVLGDIISPILGKPSASDQSAAQQQSLEMSRMAGGMSSEYWGKTAPLRDDVIGRLTDFMKGNLDPTASAQYAPLKMTAERQYDTARGQTLADMPVGGALYDNLTNLSANKAGSLTDMIGKIISDEYNKAYATAQGSPALAINAVGGAGDIASKLNQALAAQQTAGAQGTSNIVGLLKLIAEM